MYKTLKEQQMEFDVKNGILNPKMTSSQAQELIDLGANEDDVNLAYLNTGTITRMKTKHATDIVSRYPEVLSVISQKPFDQIAPDFLDDIANKAQLARNMRDLPEYEDSALDYLKNSTARTYYERQANFYYGKASDPSVDAETSNEYLKESQRLSRKAMNIRAKAPTGFVDKSMEMIGSFAGSGGDLLAAAFALSKGGAAAGGIVGTAVAPGPGTAVGSAVGGAIGFSAGIVNSFRKMFFTSQGENVQRLREANPNLSVTEASDKAELVSLAQASVEQIDLIFGIGAGAFLRKAGTKAVATGGTGLLTAGLKAVGSELVLEEGTQQLLGDTLIDAETGELSFGAQFLENLGADIVNLVDGEPLNTRNKQTLDLLKYGGPFIFATGSVGQVYQNKTEWVKKRNGEQEAQQYNNERLKTHLNEIQNQNKELNLSASPELNLAISNKLFRQPVSISVSDWEVLKQRAFERLEGKELDNFVQFTTSIENETNIEALKETNENLTLPASEYLASIGINDELLQDGMKFVKANENYLSENDENLVDYVGRDLTLERAGADQIALENVIYSKLEKSDLSEDAKNKLAISSAMRIAAAKRSLKKGADVELEQFFEEQGFDINLVETKAPTAKQRVSRQEEIEGALIRKARDEGKLEGVAGTDLDAIIKKTTDKAVKKELKSIRKEAKRLQKREEFKAGSFNEETKVISLFSDKANITTLLHEVEHWYDNLMEAAYFNDTLTPEARDTFDGVRDYFGLKEDQKFTDNHKEELADLFEQYMEDGNAPTFSLKKFFAEIRNIILDTYGMMSKKGVRINPKIKEYFDLQYVTREELRAARENDRFFARGDIESIKDENAKKYYLDQLAKARQYENDFVYRDHVRREKRENSKEISAFRKKEYELALKELSTEPVYKAQKAIMDQGKINTNNVEGQGINTDNIPPQYASTRGKVGFGLANDIDMVAEISGYDNVADMIAEISRTPSIEEAATQMSSLAVQERLDREYKKTVADVPYEALRNDNRLNVIIAESIWNEDLTINQVKDFKRMLKEKTLNLLDTMSIERVSDVAKNRNNQVKNSDLALRAFMQDNTDLSGKYFELSALNHMIAMEGYQAQNMLKTFNRITQKVLNQKNIVDKLGRDNYEMITAMLNNFTFEYDVPSSVDLSKAMDDWVERNSELTMVDTTVISDNKEFLLAGTKDLTDMNYLDFKLLNEITNAVMAQSELVHGLEAKLDESTQAAKYDFYMEGLEAKAGKVKRITTDSNSVVKADFEATTGVESSMFEFMGKDFQIGLVNPLFDGLANGSNIGAERSDAYTVLLKENDMYGLSQKKSVTIPGINVSLSEAELFQIACQWGTIESRNETLKKIEKASDQSVLGQTRENGPRKGLRLTEEQIAAIEEAIPSKYMDMAAESWKFLAQDKNAIKQTYFAVNKAQMSEVTPAEFEFKGKNYTGGYYPMFRDRMTFNENIQETFAEKMARVLLNANFTKERTGELKGDIDLTGDRIFQHLHNVQIYINAAKQYQDLGIFFNDKGDRISEIVGDVRFKTWKNWHNQIFDSTYENAFVKGLHSYGTFLAIAFKAKTALVQPTALLNAIPYVGGRNLAAAAGKILRDPSRWTFKGAIQKTNDPSFIHRVKDPAAAVAGIQKEIVGKKTSEKTRDMIMQMGFLGITYTDAIVTAQIAYEAGYMQGKQMGLSDAQARSWGGAMMRITQVDASKYSKPSVLKSPLRFLYPFMTYFMGTKTNIQEKWRAGDKVGSGMLAFNFLIVAAGIEAAIAAAINGLVEDDDEEFIDKWKRGMFMNVASNTVASTPLVSVPSLGTGVLNAVTGKNLEGTLPAIDIAPDAGFFANNLFNLGKESLGFETDRSLDDWVRKTLMSGTNFVPNQKMARLVIKSLTED